MESAGTRLKHQGTTRYRIILYENEICAQIQVALDQITELYADWILWRIEPLVS